MGKVNKKANAKLSQLSRLKAKKSAVQTLSPSSTASRGVDKRRPKNKLDKRKQRKESLLERLKSARASQDRAARLKIKGGTLREFDALGLSLADLDDVGAEKTKSSKRQGKKGVSNNRQVRTRKGRSFTGMAEMAQMQGVLAHQAYKGNPLDTIKQHLRNARGLPSV